MHSNASTGTNLTAANANQAPTADVLAETASAIDSLVAKMAANERA